jgi:hypothetical protein
MIPEVARTIEVCSRTPGAFRAILGGLGPDWTQRDYGPMPLRTSAAQADPDSVGGARTWSAHEIMAHMVFNERTDWVPRIRWVMEHGASRAFVRFDMIGHRPLLARHTLGELLEIFERERGESLAALRAMGLTAQDLDRPGLHPALGPVKLRHLLGGWIVHDLNHIAQVCKAVAFQAKEETGPWEAYMSILSPPNPCGGAPSTFA